MYLGQVLTLVNFGLLASALAVYFIAPAIATIFLYGLIVWMFASLILFYLPISRRRLGGAPRRVAAPGATPGSATPAPAAGAALPSGRSNAIGFCIYCAAEIPPGAGNCPACGRAVRTF
ncbi:MAG: hypothetical protein ACREBT_02540 [Thermoplasmata archaeon]